MKYIKDQQNLENIVSIITSRFNIEQIYLNTYESDITTYELIILVSNKYVKTLGSEVPKVVNLIRDFPQYKVICYIAFQAKDKIREGGLFLFNSCQPEKLIYKKEKSTFEIIPENYNYQNCKEAAISLHEREKQKINEFKDGYFHFKNIGKLSIASFMLHQVIELTYRNLELIILSKERITHSIRCHHIFIKESSAIYSGIFDEEKDSDIALLQILEDIYRATRYENKFEISLETLNELELKMEALCNNAEELVIKMFDVFEQQNMRTSISIAKKEIVPTSIKYAGTECLKQVVDYINIHLSELSGIYIFGNRTKSCITSGINLKEDIDQCDYYFDLLVVSQIDQREKLSNIQSKINENSGVSVFILSFTSDQVQKLLDKNNPFFHKVLQFADPLLDSLNSNWSFHENNGIRTNQELESIRTKWYNRKNHSTGFFNGGQAIEHSEEVVVKVLLFNQAIEQAALGLLEFFYGYRPYKYNLNHLFTLCCSLWQFPNDLFPRSSTEEKAIYNDFVNVVKEVRYEGMSYLDWDEAYRYQSRCEHFLEECTALVHDTFSDS
ncbi:HEPN domain-containing protein [Sphingobacterium bovistauri]|uniref:HEPN domain-containing protein n=1 Tax=Sphingobacterium bovistauri TaxID=2781959 RepID=A0ABS7Z5W7_9SPHI|nr:hypothetical protein [Sphingobacterium bovistauri]MCA5004796.1 hypothetical protein [Sphingobacterium bovistauri]